MHVIISGMCVADIYTGAVILISMVHAFEDLHKLSSTKGKVQDIRSGLSLRTFAYSIAYFLVPIYMIYNGMGFEFTALFFLIMSLIGAVFSPASVFLAKRVGFKPVILLSIPFSIIFFAMVYEMGGGGFNPLLAALFGGIGEALYFTSVNLDFVQNAKAEHRGHNIGSLDSFFKSSAVLGPVFGGWVVANYGFGLMFGMALMFLMLSMLESLKVDVYKGKGNFRFFPERIFDKENWKYFFLFIAYGAVSAAEWFLWPLFVFLLLSDFISVGVSFALVALGTAVFVGVFRNTASLYDSFAFMKVGAAVYALSWVLRANSYGASLADIYGLSFLAGAVIVLVQIPFFTDTVERAKEWNAVEFVVFREISAGIGRALFFGVVLLAVVYGVSAFTVGFIVAAVASLAFLML